jgi:TolB-like protein/Tfp pilus assembly protein PilF
LCTIDAEFDGQDGRQKTRRDSVVYMAATSSLGHSVLRIADLRVDPGLDEISKDGHTIKLEPKAMELLICLAERAGEVVSVDELLDRVWKDVIVSHDSVYAAVAALRRTLGDDPKKPTYIANVVRRGYRLVAPVSAWAEPRSASASSVGQALPERPSIAVLPLLNLSTDPAQEYFSDGITEDIITELSRWRGLAVRSRSASFRYRGGAVDMKQVARELDVRYVVEGSVRRVGERIRISVQLIDAETGSHVWGEKFDRVLDEIFIVQDQVVQTIAGTLSGRIQASDAERARRKPPSSLAAYECGWKCNALPWDDPAGAQEAMRLAEKAIELDPTYGLAHALLATLTYSRWADGPRSSEAALKRSYALAMRALELDAGESTCHALLGDICAERRSFERAVQYSRRAVEINPTNPWNAADLGSVLVYAGECEEALSWFAKAREIDPYFDEAWHWRIVAIAHMLLRRYDGALSALAHVRVRLYPIPALTAGCHAEMGATALAKASVADCLALKPEFSIKQFVGKLPLKITGHAEQLAASLSLAGLPD